MDKVTKQPQQRVRAPLVKHVRLSPEVAIALLSLSARLGTLALSSITAHLLPAFDTSHLINNGSASSASLAGLKWDAVHFASVAVNGYEYEQQLAFMPGWPYAIHLAGRAVHFLKGGQEGLSAVDVVWGGQILAIICSVASAIMLYRLTFQLTSNKSFAFTAAMFQTLLPPSPSTHVAPYTETPFALLTFSGFYLVATQRYILASLVLGLSSSVRANGILSAGVLGWEMLRTGGALRALQRGQVRRLTALSVRIAFGVSLVILPFVLFQIHTYRLMCHGKTPRPWCEATIPLSYSFVQGHYWNVGLFKYWTPAQIPNLALASPIFIISLQSSYRFFHKSPRDPKLIPYHIHHLAMTFLLMFASHSQIALRVCASDPVVWWGVADVAFEKGQGTALTRLGRVWVAWALIWGLVSIVLWAGFYPPA